MTLSGLGPEILLSCELGFGMFVQISDYCNLWDGICIKLINLAVKNISNNIMSYCKL